MQRYQTISSSLTSATFDSNFAYPGHSEQTLISRWCAFPTRGSQPVHGTCEKPRLPRWPLNHKMSISGTYVSSTWQTNWHARSWNILHRTWPLVFMNFFALIERTKFRGSMGTDQHQIKINIASNRNCAPFKSKIMKTWDHVQVSVREAQYAK